jgi:hypothetical protein
MRASSCTLAAFLAVGQAYRQFDQVSQVSDDEVRALLQTARRSNWQATTTLIWTRPTDSHGCRQARGSHLHPNRRAG